MTITLINPLPAALRHYQAELEHVLAEAGAGPVDAQVASVEQDGRTITSRALGYCHRLLGARRRQEGPAIVIWPSFGYLEVLIQRAIGPRGSLIFHDARPMVDQLGMATWQARLAGAATRLGRRDTIVHSRAAADVLRGFGWQRIHVLPHPMMPRRSQVDATANGSAPTCLVLGQYKPTRGLELLEDLPRILPDVHFRLAGRGWPAIDGWQVESAFLSEDDFDGRLRGADVLLLPYPRYFQSGVLVRAFELGVPVVSVRHEQPTSLFGAGWPGLVDRWDAASVAHAVQAAVDVPRATVSELFDQRIGDIVAEWRQYLTDRMMGSGNG